MVSKTPTISSVKIVDMFEVCTRILRILHELEKGSKIIEWIDLTFPLANLIDFYNKVIISERLMSLINIIDTILVRRYGTDDEFMISTNSIDPETGEVLTDSELITEKIIMFLSQLVPTKEDIITLVDCCNKNLLYT